MLAPEIHDDFYKSFDDKLPLDAFHADAARQPWFVALWIVLAVAALPVARALARRSSAPRLATVALWLGMLTLLPSMRDGGLSVAILGLAALWAVGARALGRRERPLQGLVRAWDATLALPPRAFAVRLFAGAFLFALALGWVTFRWIPTIQDSQAQVFQSIVFARGRLTAQTPPFSDFLLAENMLNHAGRWYGVYPPGHALLLTLGTLVHAPFVVNPLLGAATAVLIWAASREAFGEAIARGAGIVIAISPFSAFMSSEYMNHATTGACFALQLYALARWSSARRPVTLRGALGLGALAGIGAGLMFMTRPLTFAAVEAAFGLFLLERARHGRVRVAAAFALPMALVASVFLAATLLFNERVNGAPLTFAYTIAIPSMRMGFGRSVFGVHTPLRALEHTLRLLDASNLYLLGLPLPALLFAAVGFVRFRREPLAWLVVLAFGVQISAYALFPSMDLTFGPRYVYEPCLGLVPVALAALAPVSARAVGTTDRDVVRRAGALAAAMVAITILPGLGVYYRRVYSLDGGVVERARATLPEGSVVFVEGKYQRAFFAVDPDLRGPVLFVRDLGARNVELACGMRPRPAFVERQGALVPYAPACPEAPPAP